MGDEREILGAGSTTRESVLIRTEGNSSIGAGHVGRCLAVASALSELGIEAHFALSSRSLFELVRSRGFSCEVADAEIGKDEEAIRKLVTKFDAKIAIVDSYRADERYMAAVREVCPTFSFGSVGGYNVLSDIMCFYGFHAVSSSIEERYTPLGVRCLIGPDYAPLQRRFWEFQPREINEDVRNILVTSGGSDPLNICAHITAALIREPHFTNCAVHVAMGPLFGEVSDLRALAARDDRVKLHEGVELIDLLSFCDLAVCAGGTTVYEVMRVGVPAVFYSFADNQIIGQEALIPYGHIGDIRSKRGGIEPDAIDVIVNRVTSLADCRDDRVGIRRSYMKKIDGQGARRIARAIADFAM